MTRKALSLLLALTLLLCSLPGWAAGMAVSVPVGGVSIAVDDDDAVTAATNMGSTLYLLYQSGAVATRPVDNNELTVLGEVLNTQYYTEAPETEEGRARMDRLFVWDGRVYGMCTPTGEVWTLLDDTGAFAPAKVEGLTVDTSGLIRKEEGEEYSSTVELSSFFCEGDWLYYTGMVYMGTPYAVAGRMSLETGEKQDFACENLLSLAPVGDGTLMALVYDISALYSATTQVDLTQAAQYGLFDPEKDAVASLADLPTDNTMGGYSTSGICVGNGTLYYMDGSRIAGIDLATGEKRLSAYTGGGMVSNGGQVLYADGYYVLINNYNGIQVFKLDPEGIENGALTIFGEFGSEAHNKFVSNHPEIAVDVSGDYTSDIETLTQAMVADTGAYDVLLMGLSYMPVERLIEKGYCADLSQSADIMEKVSAMYPEVVEPLMVDGKLYGVPVGMSGTCYGVNMELWESLGLTEDDLPTSLPELYDFAANWVWDYGEDHPEISLFDLGSYSSQLLYSLLLNDYIAYMQKQGGELVFDTPVFRRLMEGFSAIDFEEILSVQDQDEDTYWTPNALFSTSMSVGYLGYQDERFQPLYLSLEEGGEPFIGMNLNVMTINPRTKHMDQALLYVSEYLDNLDKTSANIVLFPDHNDPVENDYYQSNLEDMQESLAKMQESLENASEENRAEIEQQIQWQEESIADWENYRYSVTAEQIADYRENVAPLIYVIRQNVFLNADTSATSEINKLLMQYIEGAVNLDSLVRELDQRVRLMQLEDQ